jgi:hypothetical protein
MGHSTDTINEYLHVISRYLCQNFLTLLTGNAADVHLYLFIYIFNFPHKYRRIQLRGVHHLSFAETLTMRPNHL